MSKMIQVRHVPDDVHGVLKARAARAGMTLSDFLRLELEQVAQRARVDELLAEAARDASVPPDAYERVWAGVRDERDAR